MENFLEIVYLKSFHFPAITLFQEKLPFYKRTEHYKFRSVAIKTLGLPSVFFN